MCPAVHAGPRIVRTSTIRYLRQDRSELLKLLGVLARVAFSPGSIPVDMEQHEVVRQRQPAHDVAPKPYKSRVFDRVLPAGLPEVAPHRLFFRRIARHEPDPMALEVRHDEIGRIRATCTASALHRALAVAAEQLRAVPYRRGSTLERTPHEQIGRAACRERV